MGHWHPPLPVKPVGAGLTSRGVGIYHLKIAPPPPALLTHCHACSDTLAFVHELRKLQQRETFQRVEFEHTVEAVRARVAAVLWQLVVVREGRGGGGGRTCCLRLVVARPRRRGMLPLYCRNWP